MWILFARNLDVNYFCWHATRSRILFWTEVVRVSQTSLTLIKFIEKY
jgi:hypothetical protein